MTTNKSNHSIEFFDTQFRRQAAASEYALNPFEQIVLPFLSGEVLDLGCGLGNLSLAAASQHCTVLALDASATAVEDLARRAYAAGLPVEALQADLRGYVPVQRYDSIVAIGLAMFFACPDAKALIARIRDAVRPGGVAAVNVLIEGTTFLGMFTPGDYCLFGERALEDAFAGWTVEYLKIDVFPAPEQTVKRFCTLVARRPARSA
jgi:tellurite methyltransferase